VILLDSISKSYGKHQVLKDIHMSLEPGKIYGVVGENGAGKTTLFKCIAGLELHDGTIKSPYSPLKNHLGFLQTDPYFFEKITGREYIRLLCNARKTPVKDLEAQNIFDLPLDQYASTYSTGMKKKLALLGILLQQNDFFILDEPYNGVDIQSNIIITEIMHQLKALGKIVVISSHIFSTLNDTCDEIYLLKAGKLANRVLRQDFGRLEQEMKDFSIGDRMERLGLR
jgi:ABC-2 type transport system ATP-binding protein